MTRTDYALGRRAAENSSKHGGRPQWEREIPAADSVSEEYLRGYQSVFPGVCASPWLPIETAPRDRTDILVKTRPDIYPENHNRSGWNNRNLVVRHEGLLNDGFDMGWSVSAPVGYGGMPDDWFVGWMPLPAPPLEVDDE